MPIETNNVVDRLRRREQLFPAMGGGSIGRDASGKATCTSYITDDGMRLVNPDGPEAADEIERLRSERQSLSDRIDVLEDLLVKYGDRVRMATAWPESVQPAIDEAFENASRRASLTQGGKTNDPFWADYEKLSPDDQIRCLTDIRFFGRAFIRNGERVDPNDFFRSAVDCVEIANRRA